jgi:hypothetical protein
MGCGCNNKKDPKELINRAKTKTTSKEVKTAQKPLVNNMSLVSLGKKPLLKPKK